MPLAFGHNPVAPCGTHLESRRTASRALPAKPRGLYVPLGAYGTYSSCPPRIPSIRSYFLFPDGAPMCPLPLGTVRRPLCGSQLNSRGNASEALPATLPELYAPSVASGHNFQRSTEDHPRCKNSSAFPGRGPRMPFFAFWQVPEAIIWLSTLGS